MADRKYGRIFTESDVEKLLEIATEYYHGREVDLPTVLAYAEEAGVRFKFGKDEPTFTLRARDLRASGAIYHYLNHQSPRAPQNHLEGIEASYKDFVAYRTDHHREVKEPD